MLTQHNGTPQRAENDPLLFELRALNARLDRIDRKVDDIDRRQRVLGDLLEEIGPIGREMMRAASDELVAMEKKGYVTFGREALRVLDRIVGSYGEDDVRKLGDNIVGILDTVRAVTQPEVLALANQATGVLERGGAVEPIGIFGMLKASRDEDVERGLAMAVEVLRRLGKSAQPPDDRMARLVARTAPKRLNPRAAASPAAAPAAASTAACAVAAHPVGAAVIAAVPGFPITTDGALLDPKSWTRDFAEATARALGVTMGLEHWKLVEFARADFLERGASPNIRRLTAGSGLSTKQIYQLFPKAPGKTAARIAGIPKPAGCI